MTKMTGNSINFVVFFLSFFFQIPDDFKGYKLESFFIPKQIENYLDSIIIPRGIIDDR